MVMLLFVQFYPIHVIQLNANKEKYILKDSVFQIRWIHSVEKELWIEEYEKRDNKLYITQTFFKTYGAGVPANAQETRTVDGYVQMNVEREMPSLDLAVSHNVETTLAINDQMIPLYEMVDDYETVYITVETINVWQYLRGEKIG